ncbi:hypothetical protein PFZ55_52555 [Streptomyces sp. MS2A]|nr:hypothetical protein [Streptomyces sp. MS2A]
MSVMHERCTKCHPLSGELNSQLLVCQNETCAADASSPLPTPPRDKSVSALSTAGGLNNAEEQLVVTYRCPGWISEAHGSLLGHESRTRWPGRPGEGQRPHPEWLPVRRRDDRLDVAASAELDARGLVGLQQFAAERRSNVFDVVRVDDPICTDKDALEACA